MSEEDEVIEEDEVTEAEQIEKAEIRKADFLAVGRARKALVWPTPGERSESSW